MSEKDIILGEMLPEWICRQASLGRKVPVDSKLTDENHFWYMLTACCPLIFEKYAIILHPFRVDSDITGNGKQGVDNEGYRLSWTDCFSLHGFEFEFETAFQNHELLSKTESCRKFSGLLYFPSEGDCPQEELTYILQKIAAQYGDINANYFYCLLKTATWQSENLFHDKLSNFGLILGNAEIQGMPTAVFPDNQEWCIVTDYDQPFTFLGGNAELIDSVLADSNYDIFAIVPRYLEKVNHSR